ncbi:hypothetical protein [Streptomyces sp. NPDC127098]|uniref:hypothetical protein n=1 Tax=Streptomyces sp. NPDC127098 TaxID=3347137 RepID=UPI00364833F9
MGLLRRLSVLFAALLPLAGIGVVATATPAAASVCREPANEKFFPGSTVTRVRYGEVSVNVVACSGGAPSGWSVVATPLTNGTGELFSLDMVSQVNNVSIGDYYRFWDVVISVRECFLWEVLDFCDTATSWTVRYYIADVEGQIVSTTSTTADEDPVSSGYTLFRTP